MRLIPALGRAPVSQDHAPNGPECDPFDAGPYRQVQDVLHVGGLDDGHIARRAVLAGLIAWAPLAAFAVAEHVAVRPNPLESFLFDFTAYARYLIAIPLFIVAERTYMPRLAQIVRHFNEGGLLRERDRQEYYSAVSSTRWLLSSRWSDAIILLLAYGLAFTMSPSFYSDQGPTWYQVSRNGTYVQTLAGRWRTLISQPLFLMVVEAWIWRMLLWTRFLWKMSRLDLELVAGHPDLLGGLRFITTSLRAFRSLAFAIGTIVASNVAQAVIFEHRSPKEFEYTVVVLVLTVLLLFAGPLLMFIHPLTVLRSRGSSEYGRLGAIVGQRFEEKWLARSSYSDPLTLQTSQPRSISTTSSATCTQSTSGCSIPVPSHRWWPRHCCPSCRSSFWSSRSIRFCINS